MLSQSLNQAFDQYVSDRVDTILSIAGITDSNYSKYAKQAQTVLEQLLRITKELEPEHPELISLVMDFEAFSAVESGFAAEIAYKQGMRDICGIRQEFTAFLQQSPCS
jgi:hypothetical protein